MGTSRLLNIRLVSRLVVQVFEQRQNYRSRMSLVGRFQRIHLTLFRRSRTRMFRRSQPPVVRVLMPKNTILGRTIRLIIDACRAHHTRLSAITINDIRRKNDGVRVRRDSADLRVAALRIFIAAGSPWPIWLRFFERYGRAPFSRSSRENLPAGIVITSRARAVNGMSRRAGTPDHYGNHYEAVWKCNAKMAFGTADNLFCVATGKKSRRRGKNNWCGAHGDREVFSSHEEQRRIPARVTN